MILIVLSVLSTLVFGWSVWKISRLKYLFLQKIIAKKIIDCPFFSTVAVKETASYILRQPYVERQELLKAVSRNDFKFILQNINQPLLKAKLLLMLKGKISALSENDSLLNLMQTGFYLSRQEYTKATKVLTKINLKTRESNLRALKNLCTARIALFEGDMLTASEEAAKALKIFQKNNLLYEEAETYFLLGEIYRVSGVFDTADFMLRTAVKLFEVLSACKAKAKVLGTLGLLMTIQRRFSEAEDYFLQAKKTLTISSDRELFYFIISQQAMLNLLQDNLKEASAQAAQSLRGHKKFAGQAFAADVLSRVAFAAKKWQQTLDYSVIAAEKYLKQKNYAARFECQYLQAEALVKKKKTKDAEKLLRQLIKEETNHKSCFHIASAYTLLGLILLQSGDIKRAKTIFNQALEQELYNDRASGAAIDYTNLALIERQCGNIDAAHKNLNAALCCAERIDEELYAQIKNIQV